MQDPNGKYTVAMEKMCVQNIQISKHNTIIKLNINTTVILNEAPSAREIVKLGGWKTLIFPSNFHNF